MIDMTDPSGAAQGSDLYLERAQSLTARIAHKRKPGDEKTFTDALLAQMRADGLLSVVVPAEFGGPGLNLTQTARITERIARQSGSAGLIYAMHMSQALSVVRHGRGPYFEDLQRRMVQGQLLIASGTSEKGPGGDIFTSIAQVELGADGRLSGVKQSPNISYLDHADLILLTANAGRQNNVTPPKEGAKISMRQVLIALERADVDVTVPYAAGFLGMRGILNQPVVLRFSAAPQAVFVDLFAPIARRTMTPCIQVLWAALWSGLAWGVIEKAKLFVHNEMGQNSPQNQPVQSASAQAESLTLARHDLSVLINKHYAMNAMLRDVIAAYEAESSGKAGGAAGRGAIGFAAAAQINRLKVCCADWLLEICTGALRLIGLRGYATSGPYTLAEALADALSAPIMVSNTRLVMNTAAIEPYVDEAF
jgi:acyl-CoA dehydrogenase